MYRFGFVLAAFLICVLMLAGCSSDTTTDTATPVDEPRTDEELIQAALDEIATRWHAGDKSVLYENEMPFLREVMPFSKYLERKEIIHLEADTLVAFNAKEFQFFDHDSADVTVEAVFIGPLFDTSYFEHHSKFFYYDGQWLRPSMSHPIQQAQHNEIRRIADSAAAAEENEEW